MSGMRSRFVDVVEEVMDEDPRVAVVLADISMDRFQAAAARHPGRLVNVGIREQALIGVAAGLALQGMRPVVHSYAPFLVERPFEQVKLDLGHQDVGAVLVSIAGSYDAVKEGRTHQSPGDVALFDTLPGWTVHVPGHAEEVETFLRDALARDDRVYIRLAAEQNAEPRSVASGRMDVVDVGSKGTVVTVGPMLHRTLEAVAGMDLTVLYAATIRPFDTATLLDTLSQPDVVLVEPYLTGTSAAVVAAALSSVRHRLLAIGVPPMELRRYGTLAELHRVHGLDARGLRERIGAFYEDAPVTAATISR